MVSRNPFNCYSPWFYVLSLACAGVVVAGAFVGHALPPRSLGRIVVALIQGASIGVVIVSVFRSIRRLDELDQRIQYESVALAFAATAMLVSTCGFLEQAGLPAISWGVWAYPLMFGIWGIAWVVVAQRYR
jgi:hypothetical protein